MARDVNEEQPFWKTDDFWTMVLIAVIIIFLVIAFSPLKGVLSDSLAWFDREATGASLTSYTCDPAKYC